MYNKKSPGVKTSGQTHMRNFVEHKDIARHKRKT